MEYVLIAVLLLVCALFGVNSKSQKVLYFVFSILFSAIFAIRSDSSPDTTEYIRIFQSVHTYDNWLDVFERYEVGYCVLNRFVKLFFDDYRVVFFLVSMINFTVFYAVINIILDEIRKNNDRIKLYYRYLPVLALYTSYYGLLYNAIALRAGLAISFLYLSFALIYKRNIIWGLIPYFVAILFHETALLAFPLFFLFYSRFKFSKQSSLIILFLSFIIYILNIRDLTSSFIPFVADSLYNRFPDITVLWWISHYTENNFAQSGSISVYMLFCFILCFVLICNSSRYEAIKSFTCVYLLGVLLYSLFGNYTLMVRYVEYFLFAVCVAFGVVFSFSRNVKLSDSLHGLSINVNLFVLFTTIAFYLIFLRNSVQVL